MNDGGNDGGFESDGEPLSADAVYDADTLHVVQSVVDPEGANDDDPVALDSIDDVGDTDADPDTDGEIEVLTDIVEQSEAVCETLAEHVAAIAGDGVSTGAGDLLTVTECVPETEGESVAPTESVRVIDTVEQGETENV